MGLAEAAGPDASVPTSPDASVEDGGAGDSSVLPVPDGALDAPWWNADYRSRLPLTIRESLPNVPDHPLAVMVRLTPDRFPYERANSDGSDLRFVLGSTVLPHEIETFVVDRESVAWVRLPEGAATDGARLDMYFNNPQAADPQSGAAVWSEYLGVWHLADAAEDEGSGTGTHRDASGQEHHGDQDGNVLVYGDGAIGGAQSFDGENDRIAIPAAGLGDATDKLTMIVRAAPAAQAGHATEPSVLGAGTGGLFPDARRRQIWWRPESGGWSSRLQVSAIKHELAAPDPAPKPADETWTYLAIEYDGSEARFYVDGELAASATAFGWADAFSSSLVLGDNPYQDRPFSGRIDEVRLAHFARGPLWFAMQARILDDSFFDYGAVTTLPAGFKP